MNNNTLTALDSFRKAVTYHGQCCVDLANCLTDEKDAICELRCTNALRKAQAELDAASQKLAESIQEEKALYDNDTDDTAQPGDWRRALNMLMNVQVQARNEICSVKQPVDAAEQAAPK